MLIDNKKQIDEFSPKTVYDFLYKYIIENNKKGEINAITGFFSIAGLALLKDNLNPNIGSYKMMLGELTSSESSKENMLDFLTPNLDFENSVASNDFAHKAIDFINQNNVELKTLKPNFCHAKTYIFKHEKKDPQANFYVLGSSNLTEAGLGTKPSSNIELNTADFGASSDYKQLLDWFNDFWGSDNAKPTIEIDGEKRNLKEYLIELIQQNFRKYGPEEIYYKILFELFGEEIVNIDLNPEFQLELNHVKESLVYNKLFNFQKKGVISLIDKIKKYKGAILADAVGLGKTWQALCVIKFFENSGYRVVLLCPKKLEQNWVKYKKGRNSIFEEDKFDYEVRYHTDLQDERLNKDGITLDGFFQNNPKIFFVIDESHNLRNDASSRYEFLKEKLLNKITSHNKDVRVLLLTATPINTKMTDIRNQFKLIARGEDKGFSESFGINSLETVFGHAQTALNEWQSKSSESRSIADFINKIADSAFFNLTDQLVVARTREFIKKHAGQEELVFPKKLKPDSFGGNIYISTDNIGKLKTFDDIFKACEVNMTAYRIVHYTKQKVAKSAIEDENQRAHFLVKMMYILLIKRLESSWNSFMKTVDTILIHHENALLKVDTFITTNVDETIDNDSELNSELDDEQKEVVENLDLLGNNNEDKDVNVDLTLGKKKPISLKEVTDINLFRKHLQNDVNKLRSLKENLLYFANIIEQENTEKSADKKLEKLIEILIKKEQENNKKVLIFTAFTDTATYLYNELSKRGFSKIAMVSGSGGKTIEGLSKDFEPVLERFAPYTKLFNEKSWDRIYRSLDIDPEIRPKTFDEWKIFIAEHDEKVKYQLENPIDILIATDCLSEGQNLQDCDCVINYDIHWNPVRLIQRMGRIDRLKSPNEFVRGYNFWPAKSFEDLLNLKNRVEKRMALLSLVGAEFEEDLSPEMQEIVNKSNNPLISKQTEKMLRDLQLDWEVIEDGKESPGLNHLTLEDFRQDLRAMFEKEKNKFRKMPNGIYSGFNMLDDNTLKELKTGLIALMGYPKRIDGSRSHKYSEYIMLYCTENGEMAYFNQQQILSLLMLHKKQDRKGLEKVDAGDEQSILFLKNMLETTLKIKANGSNDGKANEESINNIKLLQLGAESNKNKEKPKTEDKYNPQNLDLICWLLANKTLKK